ncbi:ornithine cyclodeaminase family protein [Neisseria lisongii]|uniref:Ornithine cyclodeaminase family protein n=1 Tax=Neisseria lisongii TaxID=2912188 RepID=A0AAW5AQ21_9NEIS|nr:ornithine cyclodeaminase family protein [Neisseria lisongii]MCF7530297.1 ornithine cyclodeaminase family protein [Neisseria lisongii]
MLHYDSQQTSAALPFPKLVQAIKKMFSDGCEVPLRHNHAINNAEGGKLGTLLLMPAWQPQSSLGVKTVSIFPGNHQHHLPGLHSVYILYSAQTGKPAAIFDGDCITSRRTAASSALAARYLSREDSRTLLIVGAGRVAELLAEAYLSVRPIQKFLIWNQTHHKAEALASRLQKKGLAAEAVSSLEEAVKQSDIVSCATLSTTPLIKREWLRPGTHLDLIGGFTPEMRESDDACFADTCVFVDTEEALMKAGDLLSPIQAGIFAPEQVKATLSDLCRNHHQGRLNQHEITVFKSVGSALEDLAAAVLAYETLNP